MLSPAYRHTHGHTNTHSVLRFSLSKRLERQATRETTHSCLTFSFVSTDGIFVVADHLAIQIFTLVGSSCPCWTWPPADTVLSSVKKVGEVKNTSSSASFFSLTVAIKAPLQTLTNMEFEPSQAFST